MATPYLVVDGAAKAIEMVAGMVQETARATAEQSETSRAIGRQAETVRDYTKTLKRALSEFYDDEK